jgi:hypothetical protein
MSGGPKIELLLERLEAVRPAGHERWKARCPAHPDKNPSLSIRETPEGRILIHCFSGCVAADVLDAVGLSFADVQPKIEHRLAPVKREPRSVSGWIKVLHRNGHVLLSKPLSDDEYARTLGAVRQIADDVPDAIYRDCLIVSLAATARARSETLDDCNLDALKSAVERLAG